MIRLCNIFVDDLQFLPHLHSRSEELKTRLTPIQRLFGFHKAVQLHFFDTNVALSQMLGYSLPSWVKGVAFNRYICLVRKEGWTTDPDDSLTDLLIHEYVHIAVANTFRTSCPTWLNEGLAIIFSGQAGSMDTGRCKPAYHYYDKGYDDTMFYAQSAYVVKKLINSYGAGFIVKRAKKCLEFSGDSVFGRDNLTLKSIIPPDGERGI